MKKILFTTIGQINSLRHMDYFYYRQENGAISCCTGISVAEAGTKYLLSTEQIDEIIVFGAENLVHPEEQSERIVLRERELPKQTELKFMSDYGFFCYRIQQFMFDLDIEANDICEIFTAGQTAEMMQNAEALYQKHFGRQPLKTAFLQFCDDPEKQRAFVKDGISKNISMAEGSWVMDYWYRKLNSIYKMHILRTNADVTVSFLPAVRNGQKGFDLEHLNHAFSELLARLNDDVCLYIDLQGLGFSDAFALYNILRTLSVKNKKKTILSNVIQGMVDHELFVHPIQDETERAKMQELLTAIDAFLTYGKAEKLVEFWEGRNYVNPNVNRMLIGLQYIDEGISLCNISMLQYGIKVIRQVFRVQEASDAGEDFFYSLFASLIRSDFEKLLQSENDVDIPQLLKWTIRKGMYQQALTIVESQIPEDMERRGIYYYAKDREDAERVMKEMNVLYWGENPKSRYFLLEPPHYLLKYYGRSLLARSMAKEKASRDLAHLRIFQLHGQTEALAAYSDLNNDDMLYELILNYLTVCRLRNEVFHALPPENALPRGEELKKPNAMQTLREALSRFAQIYDSACRRAAKNPAAPYTITAEEFRNYTARHRLQLLETGENGLLEQNVSCDYNGSEISIRIRMFAPNLEPEEDV